MKKSLIFLVGLLATSTMIFGDAQLKHYGSLDTRPPFVREWNDLEIKLRLTNKQQAKALKINAKYDKKYLRYSKKMHPLHSKLREELMKKKPGISKSRLLLDKLSNLKTNRRIDQLKHRRQLMTIMNDDQKNGFMAILNQYPNPDNYPNPDKHPRLKRKKITPDPDKKPLRKRRADKRKREKLKQEIKEELQKDSVEKEL